ncbi:polysialyltransferase family glycosyltransferase [Streptomyces sp. TP-A0874]|uniref:polysialyltransferase family glycosyltransferase n=1 Tax=Streptomyces sp. TP-A0874 TaxID=549819 RepID=UPI000853278E|nr:polysialyltransferase family glycosyltransferase [Streptomyces sp. TP-A0874]
MSAVPASPAASRPRRRTQIFLASTLYGAATLAAALDAECFAPAGRRLLLVTNNAATPETTPPLDAAPGFERLRDRFDRVVSWNEAISPYHPGGWAPRPGDVPLWERHLRLLWALGDDEVELVVESIQVRPALALVQLFPDAPVDVYADGLMSYGPTRNRLDPLVGTRVRRLLHLDLVPGLRPLLLDEFDVERRIVPAEAFLSVLDALAAAPDGFASAEPPGEEAPALLLGQYLSALDILDVEEEEELHLAMVRGAAALGHRRIVFKPHPTAPAHWSRRLAEEAAGLGVELVVLEAPVLAEALYRRMRPALVVGCFSTALLTARTLFGLPTARTGTGLLLERLTPYENGNRAPVTIVDALLPDLAGDRDLLADPATAGTAGREPAEVRLGELLDAVGYAMQPLLRPDLRPAAERYLKEHPEAVVRRYFKRRRLTALALPGGGTRRRLPIPGEAVLRRAARFARRRLTRASRAGAKPVTSG